MKIWAYSAFLLPSPALAVAFDRPVPPTQTDAAELAYLFASVALIAALVVMQLLVNRR